MKGTSTTDRSTLPLSALRLSPRNVRRVKPSSIEVMAASIRTRRDSEPRGHPGPGESRQL